jgi:ATP-binding cassette subfamily F protein 3
VADGHVGLFDGDLDEYAAWLRSRGSNSTAGESAKAKPAAPVKQAKTVVGKDRKSAKAR